MFRFLLILLLCLSSSVTLKAQTEEKKIDIFPEAQFRIFWMNTSYPNQDFKSDYALGTSLNLGGNVTYAKRWNFRLGYRSFANLISSEIWTPDPITRQANRYEAGLFDLLNPEDRFFGKLETFSLSYSHENFGVKLGRMGITTDWVNAQDGRLSPTAVEGLNTWVFLNKKWKLNFWAINRMSIRGSSEWLGVGETIGIYPQGRTVSGKPGNYFGQTNSKWLWISELDRQWSGGSKFHFSHTLAQNLFGTYWASFEKNKKIKTTTWTLGVQSGIQQGVGVGGNADANLAYKMPEDLNFAASARLGWRKEHWTTHLNYTHVGGKGRWLSPREWGKDAWYTFIPRERNEGFESVNALVGYVDYRLKKTPIQFYLHGGFHWLSDPADVAANKYNFPSYRQINLGVKYQPEKHKNLDFHFILVSKEPISKEKLQAIQLYNKVELLHFNGIINWKLN
jgi:hypothetical protein